MNKEDIGKTWISKKGKKCVVIKNIQLKTSTTVDYLTEVTTHSKYVNVYAESEEGMSMMLTEEFFLQVYEPLLPNHNNVVNLLDNIWKIAS